MTITVTLGKRPDLTPEEAQQRIRRAAEVLDGAGWLFDEHISSLTQSLLDAATPEAREDTHRSIKATAELKARLVQIVNSKTLEEKRGKNASQSY